MENYQIINEFSNLGEALDAILHEHKELTKNEWNLQYITDSVATQVNITLSKELNRIRLGTNNTDRNKQILIELLQGFIQMQNLKQIVTTDILKPDFLTYSENLVQDRITHQKQRKHSKQ